MARKQVSGFVYAENKSITIIIKLRNVILNYTKHDEETDNVYGKRRKNNASIASHTVRQFSPGIKR